MRKTVERITYRTLKAEIRALLDRPGVVPGTDWRIMEWLRVRYWARYKKENPEPPEPPTFEEVQNQIKGDLLERVEKALDLPFCELTERAKQERDASKWSLGSEVSSHPDAVNITYRMTRKIPSGVPENDVKEITLAKDDIAGLMLFIQSVEQGE